MNDKREDTEDFYLSEYIAVMGFFWWADFKSYLGKKWDRFMEIVSIHIWHRRHVFDFHTFRPNEDLSECRCLFCPKILSQVLGASQKPNWKAFLIVLFLAASTRADSFLGAKADSVFIRDSTYNISVLLKESTCDSAFPCIMNFVDGVGPGGYFFNLHGKPGDTISVKYNFPSSAFRADAVRITFTGPAGTIRAGWNIVLGARKATGLRILVPVGLGVVWLGFMKYDYNGRTRK